MPYLIVDIYLSIRTNSLATKDELLSAIAADSKDPAAMGSFVEGLLKRLAAKEIAGVLSWNVNKASKLSKPDLPEVDLKQKGAST